MKRILVSITTSVLLSVAISADASVQSEDKLPAAGKGQTWKLVWNDEFDGARLDEKKWGIPEFPRRDAQWSRKAIALDGKSSLALKVLKEGDAYLDGCVRTKNMFEPTFGYFVARIKLHKNPGHWPAFWLYNDSVNRIGDEGMDGTEIDIMEKPWLDHRVQQTLHWDGYGKEHKSEGFIAEVPDVMDGWHTFGLLWTPDEYVFFVDEKETWRTKAGGVCQAPLYIKLSDEIEFESWAGDIRKAHVPDETLVDYVRVYDLIEEKTGNRVFKAKRF